MHFFLKFTQNNLEANPLYGITRAHISPSLGPFIFVSILVLLALSFFSLKIIHHSF